MNPLSSLRAGRDADGDGVGCGGPCTQPAPRAMPTLTRLGAQPHTFQIRPHPNAWQ